MAFAFGLLHGFGFGGALKAIGLPQSDVPLALLTFNLDVEAGQLLFVGCVLVLAAVVNRLLDLHLRRLRDATAYAIGSVAAVWFIQRSNLNFAGKLEDELRRRVWFVAPGNPDLIFDEDRERLWATVAPRTIRAIPVPNERGPVFGTYRGVR